MTKDFDHIPTEEEVLQEISEYNNRRSGPVLDNASKAKGLERFFTDVLHGKSWKYHHQTENIKPIGLDSENGTIEN